MGKLYAVATVAVMLVVERCESGHLLEGKARWTHNEAMAKIPCGRGLR